MGARLYQVARNVEVLTMYQELLRKIAEEKPSYHEEEIQWLLDHWEILLQKFAMTLFL